MRTLVLGVGNPIMTDDAVGLRVARRVRERLRPGDPVEVRESHRGGLDLVDLMTGFHRAVVVDAFLLDSAPPGTVLRKDLADFALTQHLFGAHGVDLPTAIALGRELGAAMPEEVRIVGVVVEDPYTLGETMSPAVEAAVEAAAGVVLELAGVSRGSLQDDA